MTQKPHNLPKGVIWEKNSAYVEFTLDELKCKEKISHLKPSVENIQQAVEFKTSIENKIKNNNFDYRTEFPKSKYWKILDRVKELKNIEIHRNTIRLSFIFQGKRRREALRNVEVTLANLNHAESKLHTINFEIAANKFNYQEHFPNSKAPASLGLLTLVPTVEEACNNYLTNKAAEGIKDIVKYRGYINNHILPKFGQRKLDTILPSEIEFWQQAELSEKLSPKTIKNLLVPFKSIFDRAAKDRIITFNPYEHAQKVKVTTENKADPFELSELKIISCQDTSFLNEKHGFLFSCWSGVRLSEWLALSWSDIDFKNGTASIRRGAVNNQFSVPKNKSSDRTIDLLDQALEILERQKAITFDLPPIEIQTLDWDRKTTFNETIRPVFINTHSNKPYGDGGNINKTFFAPFLQQCGLRYRGINQARHTYGSQMLTKGLAERWIADQMGHTSTEMLQKHYGKWMKAEIPDMARQVSKLFKDELPPESPQK